MEIYISREGGNKKLKVTELHIILETNERHLHAVEVKVEGIDEPIRIYPREYELSES